MSEKQKTTPDLFSDQIDARFFVTWITTAFLSQRLGLSSAIREDLDSLLNVLLKREPSELRDEMAQVIGMVKPLFDDKNVESSQESVQEESVP